MSFTVRCGFWYQRFVANVRFVNNWEQWLYIPTFFQIVSLRRNLRILKLLSWSIEKWDWWFFSLVKRKRKVKLEIYWTFWILRRIGEVAYELALTPIWQKIIMCSMFHSLRKYVHDLSHVLTQEPPDRWVLSLWGETYQDFGYPSQGIKEL